MLSIKQDTKLQKELKETVKQARNYGSHYLKEPKLYIAGQKLELYCTSFIAGGLAAAVGTAAVAKNSTEENEQERIKKEDPLQYKKYKRGDLQKKN